MNFKTINWKDFAYVVGAIIIVGAFAFVYFKFIAPAPVAATSSGNAMANVANDIGLAGLPIPKSHTSKGAWCYCNDDTKCSGKFNDCSCCNRPGRIKIA